MSSSSPPRLSEGHGGVQECVQFDVVVYRNVYSLRETDVEGVQSEVVCRKVYSLGQQVMSPSGWEVRTLGQ